MLLVEGFAQVPRDHALATPAVRLGAGARLDTLSALTGGDPTMERMVLNGVALLGPAGGSDTRIAADTYLAYLPQNHALSSDTIARVVITCAARPGTQERLTRELGDILDAMLEPHGVAVLIDTSRPGWPRPDRADDAPRLITSRLLGAFRDEPERRAAFFGWAGRRQHPGLRPCT